MAVLFSTIFAVLLGSLCVVEFIVNVIVIYAIWKGRLWTQSSTYILSLSNLINDQFLLLCHMIYLIPALFAQSLLSDDGPSGLFPSVMNWGLLAGWYVTSFTLAYIALTRFVVIVFNSLALTFWVAVLSMLLIFAASWSMSVVAQFVFPCCQMVMHPFNYGYGYIEKAGTPNTSNTYFDFPLNNAVSAITLGCYSLIICKLMIIRRRHGVRATQMKGAKEYTYALQFCVISLFYVFNWVSTRVNPYIFGSNLEWYSCGAFFLIFNCGANGVIYVWRNREVRQALLGMPSPPANSIRRTLWTDQNRSVATLSVVPKSSNVDSSAGTRKKNDLNE